MKNSICVFVLFLLLFLNYESVFSQPLTGTKTIPGDYATIKIAVNALNTYGVGTGGVTFNVSAGYSESLASDSIYITASGTASNPIVFQKSGSGSNPCVTRTDAGTKTTSSIGGNGDAVIIVEGSDYITFNAIDVTASNSGIEYGYYVRKASATDGCKYLTIKNCVITMTKGTSAYVIGLYTSNNIITSSLSSSAGVTVTAESGRHENVTITGNTVQNTFAGMYFVGYNHTVSPYNFYDQNFVIGAEGEGNTIKNFGGNAASTVNGINIIYHNNESIAYNTINNTDGGNTGFTTYGNGILLNTGKAVTINVSYNTISLTNTSAATGKYLYCIQVNAGDASSNITINNNTFQNCVVNGTGAFSAIYHGTVASINIYGNTISGITGVSSLYPIYNYAGTGTNYIYRNSISDVTTSGASASVYCIYITKGTNYIYNNLIYNITAPLSSGTADLIRGISITSTTASTVNGVYFNTVYLNSTTGGANFGSSCIYHTYNAVSTTAALDMRNNILVNKSAAFGTGITAALRRSASTDLLNFSEISNNNCLYAGTLGVSNLIYYDGTNSIQSIADYKSYVTPRESSSFTEDPPFVNVLIPPYDLHLNGNPSYCVNGGIPIINPISITTDFDGRDRNSTAPNVGAFESEPIAGKVTLTSPANNSINTPLNPVLIWQKASGKKLKNDAKSILCYWLQYSADSSFSNSIIDSTLTDTVKSLSGLSAGIKYFWKVRAKNVTGWGEFSDIWNFTTLISAPSAPALLLPVNNAVNQPLSVTFIWSKTVEPTVANRNINMVKARDGVMTILGYWFELSTDSLFSTIVQRDTLLTDTTKTISSLTNNTEYFWRVKAKNQAGWGEFSAKWNFTTIPQIPIAPILSSPGNFSNNVSLTPVLNWNAAAFATGYGIQISQDSLFSNTVLDTSVVSGTSLTVPANKLTGLTKYYWRVNASNNAGTGPWSEPWSFTTLQNLVLNLKVYLEGFWNGGLHITDTTRIYLAGSSSPFLFADSAVVLLSSTGNLTAVFSNVPNGSYFIVVKHRNHLETWSKVSQLFATNTAVNYDFTVDSSRAYGDNMKRNGSSWVLYSGDANQDGSIDALDAAIFIAQFGNTGYFSCDFNGDFSVDAQDVSIFVSNYGLAKSCPGSIKMRGNEMPEKNAMHKIKNKKTIGKESIRN